MATLRRFMTDASAPCLFLDGGFSTELERSYGCDLSATDLWSAVLLKDPGPHGCDAIRNVHLDYLRAGADVVTTSSYQATVDGFVKSCHISVEAAEALLCRSVVLACEARDIYLREKADTAQPQQQRPPYVALSLGCYGAMLADGSEFTGAYPAETLTEEFLYKFHKDRLEVYRRGGVLASSSSSAKQPHMADFLAFETVPTPVEARAIARLMREEAVRFGDKATPFWVSFTGRDHDHVSSGDTVAECFAPLVADSAGGPVPGLLSLGFNCTHPDHFEGLLAAGARYLASASAAAKDSVALGCYPNLGEEWDAVARDWKKATGMNTETFGPRVGQWVREIGNTYGVAVGLVGGCCRSTPEMITNVRAFLTKKAEA